MGSIHIADRDEQIERCFSVMVQLRPHLKPEAFVENSEMCHGPMEESERELEGSSR